MDRAPFYNAASLPLLRMKPERFELAAPLGGRIAQSFDADTAQQAAFDRCPYQIGRKECE